LTSKFNSQEEFWATRFADKYRSANSNFDQELNTKAWELILKKIPSGSFSSILECGCNIGRNITTLNSSFPQTTFGVVEINKMALDICLATNKVDHSFLGPIKEAEFDFRFDVVFSAGVLIHVAPEDLLASLTNMYELSRKYLIVAEYFNRTPISIEYHGEKEKLFKRDWGKFVIENFDVSVIDYGFLWGHEFDAAGFDDITFWVFTKN
jgi:pseudaminic acid biosynthesis-associated methylase